MTATTLRGDAMPIADRSPERALDPLRQARDAILREALGSGTDEIARLSASDAFG